MESGRDIALRSLILPGFQNDSKSFLSQVYPPVPAMEIIRAFLVFHSSFLSFLFFFLLFYTMPCRFIDLRRHWLLLFSSVSNPNFSENYVICKQVVKDLLLQNLLRHKENMPLAKHLWDLWQSNSWFFPPKLEQLHFHSSEEVGFEIDLFVLSFSPFYLKCLILLHTIGDFVSLIYHSQTALQMYILVHTGWVMTKYVAPYYTRHAQGTYNSACYFVKK